jgi:hypothetical protein
MGFGYLKAQCYDSQENDGKALVVRSYLYGMNNSKDLKVHSQGTDIIKT